MRAERKEGLTVPGGHQGGCTEAGDTALVLEGCGRGGMTCLRTVKVSGAPVERMCWEGRAERMWVGARKDQAKEFGFCSVRQ